MNSFSGTIIKLGINPCLDVPEKVLSKLFKESGKTKGPIPVTGTLNGKPFRQTVVKYKGEWRLYLNGQMRKDAGIDVGDEGKVKIQFDPNPREVPKHSKFSAALSKDNIAKKAYEKLSPSHQKEILKYLHSSKNPETTARNIEKVIQQLNGKKSKDINFLVQDR